MNNTLKIIISAILSAAAGSAVTWKLLDKKYQNIMNKEIEETKEMLSSKSDVLEKVTIIKEKGLVTAEERAEFLKNKPDVIDYAKKIEELEYVPKKEIISDPEVLEKDAPGNYPFLIPPDELGENGYEICTVSYYLDHFLVNDETDHVYTIDEVETFIGMEALESFGEYEDDAVHVRNPLLKIDYEILLKLNKYEAD